MKKSIIIILAVVAILVIWAVSVYNGLVTMDENVTGKWANVETQYQRRADLIPNLVNTVKGYATHEKETLEGVVAARSEATQIKVDAADLTPEKLAQYQKAQGAVTSALGKLLAITENYPDLKANQNFLELQAQLEGTENRINVARKNFNDAAQAYNTNIRRFPKNIFAGMFGFDKKAYFEADISTSHFTKDGPDKHGFLIERYIYFPFNHKCHFTALNHYIRDAILKHSLGNNQVSVSIENQLIIKFSTTILSTNIEHYFMSSFFSQNISLLFFIPLKKSIFAL